MHLYGGLVLAGRPITTLAIFLYFSVTGLAPARTKASLFKNDMAAITSHRVILVDRRATIPQVISDTAFTELHVFQIPSRSTY